MNDQPRNTTIEPPTIVFNFTCFGSSRWALDYLAAAKNFPFSERFSPVPYFLYCQALELGLKAILMLKKVPKDELKTEFGHDLVKLLSAARKLGLENYVAITAEDVTVIEMVNPRYQNRQLQYIDVGWVVSAFKGLPDLKLLAALAERVVGDEALQNVYLNNENVPPL